MGKFKKLNFEWNVDVSWLDMAQNRGMLGDPHILHYIGGGKKLPWDPQSNNYTFWGKNYTLLWEQYYNNGAI
jgi:lipopolysaccharide biosynthesis glycosyltransferase